MVKFIDNDYIYEQNMTLDITFKKHLKYFAISDMESFK